jgi:hypothetical protein
MTRRCCSWDSEEKQQDMQATGWQQQATSVTNQLNSLLYLAAELSTRRCNTRSLPTQFSCIQLLQINRSSLQETKINNTINQIKHKNVQYSRNPPVL